MSHNMQWTCTVHGVMTSLDEMEHDECDASDSCTAPPAGTAKTSRIGFTEEHKAAEAHCGQSGLPHFLQLKSKPALLFRDSPKKWQEMLPLFPAICPNSTATAIPATATKTLQISDGSLRHRATTEGQLLPLHALPLAPMVRR